MPPSDVGTSPALPASPPRPDAPPLRLAVPADVANRLIRLKRKNPTLARAYFNTDTWALQIGFSNSGSRPDVAPKSGSSAFDSLGSWVNYISTADKIADLAHKYWDQLLGALSDWWDTLGDWLSQGWDWLLSLLGV